MTDEGEVSVICPQDDADLEALHTLCLMHGRDMAPSSVNPQKVMDRLKLAADTPEQFVMLMAVKRTRLIGYLNLQKAGWWFGDEHFLCDWGFYVLPAFREGGEVGRALLAAAKEVAEIANLHLRICITNPERRRGRMNREAEVVGFTPIGSTLRFGTAAPPTLN